MAEVLCSPAIMTAIMCSDEEKVSYLSPPGLRQIGRKFRIEQVTHEFTPFPATSMMSSMPLPAFAMLPSTFSVKHPLYCDSIQQSNLSYMSINASISSSPTTKARKSRLVFNFTMEEMAKYFHMSQREAAQHLGVATVTIKRNCRRLGIVWPYRLMKSKNIVNNSTISREDAKRIRQERALKRAKTSRSPFRKNRSRSQSPSASHLNAPDNDERAAKIKTMFSCSRNSGIELTEAGRAFARLPLDCMNTN